MRAFVIDKNTELDQLQSKLRDDAPEPVPGKNEVLVDVYAAGANFFDILQAAGKYQVKPPHPFVPGAELAGIIAPNSPIPDGCPYEPGTRVFGAAQGSYGERVKADWQQLVQVPDEMSLEEAATLFITWPTSYAALRYRANIQPGEWLLVHAGAGGVGLAAVQLGKRMGAKVIATAGSEEKLDVCKRLGGADYAVNYRDKDWAKKVKEITGGKGADVVYDPVGLINASLKCIAWNGRIVVVGFAAGEIEKIPANLLLLKNCAVTGVHWGRYIREEPDKVYETWGTLLDWFSSGEIKPIIFNPIYQGLESVPKALSDLAQRKTWGKAVVSIKKEKGQHGKL
ncbi:unnamed protein product [Tilletia controversa]|uniref:Enoyl reductase (ER) domain-containing protein n=3 Tax=Tilletia TaxID=13289 RepID=A0A8X7MNL9_9BASI|nr:hypothetical protein CF336_g4605 [Tilletia laevis]KAE8196102.1 hypothetical protein CF328_g4234 [Tilletia controversa]KAE8261173.1 hypothetical protein A4X03_0g3482 [Tilletia caries]KAE8201399.1 hypothetical protein CF335_g3750 [Tilletia laevis]KAE8243203.1 hypothetical protein A4X06_0g6482 [Tilletia controversa]